MSGITFDTGGLIAVDRGDGQVVVTSDAGDLKRLDPTLTVLSV